MKETKFKIWDKRVGIMMGPYTIQQMWEWTHKEKHSSQDLIFLQFTGLKDKNDKEIYEGDILQWSDLTNIKNRWEVKFTNSGWNPFIDDMTTDKPFRYEIIGNIYENQKLLKEN